MKLTSKVRYLLSPFGASMPKKKKKEGEGGEDGGQKEDTGSKQITEKKGTITTATKEQL